jgi:hypothetical protein
VWRDPYTFELVTIDSFNASTITIDGTLASTWAGDGQNWVIPVRPGILDPAAMQIVGPAAGVVEVSFLCESVPQGTETADLLELEPSRNGDVNAAFEPRASRLDSPSGAIATVARSQAPAVTWNPFVWICDGRDEAAEMLEFLSARSGRLVPCFVPTWQRDLVLTEPIAADATEIRIRKSGYTEFLFDRVGRHKLALLLFDGQKAYVSVTAAEVDGDEEVLTLAEAPGIAVPLNSMVSFHRYVRLSGDEPELIWHTTDVAEAALDFTELLLPPLSIVTGCPTETVPYGEAWTYQLEASGGAGDLLWTIEGPAGITISETGLIAKTAYSDFEFTATVTDSAGQQATLECAVQVAWARPTAHNINPAEGPTVRGEIDDPELAYDNDPDTPAANTLSGGVGTSVFATTHYDGIPAPPPGFTQATFKARVRYTPGGGGGLGTIKITAHDGEVTNYAVDGIVLHHQPAVGMGWTTFAAAPISAAAYNALANPTMRVVHYHLSGEFALPYPILEWGDLGVVFT